MKVIRKIWVGESIKAGISWEVGQSVRLGPEGYAKISRIVKTQEGHEIYINRDNVEVPWKTIDMDSTVEYDISIL